MAQIIQNNALLFNSLHEYLNFSIVNQNNRFVSDFIGEKRNAGIPDPKEYEIDDELFKYLGNFIVLLNNKKIDTKDAFQEIINHIEKNFKHSYLENLILIFSYFLLRNKCKSILLCYNVFKLYELNIISIQELEFVTEIFSFLCEKTSNCEPERGTILFIYSTGDENNATHDYLSFIDEIGEIYTQFTIKYLNIYEYTDWNEVINKIKGIKYELVIFMTHGNDSDGLILDFKNIDDKLRVDSNILLSLKDILNEEQNPIFLLGCNSMNYRNKEFDFINRISTSTGWSRKEMFLFVFGYLESMTECRNITSNFNSGRISLMLRAHSMCDIHLDYVRT